ncbi:hypothetical protein GKE82_23580 [Conexibacter sp. W3-3-2]|uniref:hypothetical protein n=1 Tax=Conexibacter sp. W3-3-2 TaxID=2675227 RepID=UPI0012B99839|nr:hypothetical protein [Conexibacter sp. W3-3-2]MTD47187.1 hypothetical protein [Conexibacter sp. W3-3-2]
MSDSFARSIAQAAATRGQLDPFYRAISDHWTLMALRLWPVGVVAAPDLADPAHIDMRSRSIYLDTERLLGADRDLRAGQITDRGIWRTWGACAHEVFHAMETRTWAIDQIDAHATANDRPQLLQDALLLEEPRMEHQGLQRFDPATARGRFLRGALAVVAQDILIDALSEHLATTAMTDPAALRDAAGRAAVYVLGRERYGVLTATDTRLLNQAVRAVLGGTDHQALIDLLDELIWIPSGEPEQLIAIAERYRTIIGDPPPPPPTSGQGPGSPSQSTPSQNPGNDPTQNTGEGQAQSAGNDPAQSRGRTRPRAGGRGRPRARGRGRPGAWVRRWPKASPPPSRPPGPPTGSPPTPPPSASPAAATRPRPHRAPADPSPRPPACRPAGCPTSASTGPRPPTSAAWPASSPTASGAPWPSSSARSPRPPRAAASTPASTCAPSPNAPAVSPSPHSPGASPPSAPSPSTNRTSA